MAQFTYFVYPSTATITAVYLFQHKHILFIFIILLRRFFAVSVLKHIFIFDVVRSALIIQLKIVDELRSLNEIDSESFFYENILEKKRITYKNKVLVKK